MIDKPVSMQECLDILLVHLPFYDNDYPLVPQLGLLYVGSSLRSAGFRVGVLEEAKMGADSFVGYVTRYRPQILGFHVTTDSFSRTCRAIDILRKNNIEPPLVVFGGPHVTIEDQSLLRKGFGRIVVRGEGEETTVEIARWWLRGEGGLESIQGITYRSPDERIVRNPDREFITDLDRLPEPDMKLLMKQPSVKTFHMVSGRGCPYQCAFCAAGLIGPRYRFRSPESVLKEIRSIVGNADKAYLAIVDDTFTVQRDRVEAIAKGLIKEYGPANRLVWFCEGRVDFINRNRDLFPLLREAGLVRIQLGIESGNQNILDLYRKNIRVEEIEEAVSILRDAEIPSIHGNFIIGGAMETPETVQQSIELAKRLISLAPGQMECTASMLGVYPGTAISKDPSRFGLRIIDSQMRRGISLLHPVAVTEKMGVTEILAAYNEFYQEVTQAYEAVVSSIPYSLIRRHTDLQSYGLTTPWCKIFMSYPCIRSYYEMLNSGGYQSIGKISAAELMALVPHRTARVLDVHEGQLAVKVHPRAVVFNKMSAQIYQLCSGKQTVEEIIRALQQNLDDLPPEPFLSEHVKEVLIHMHDRFLVAFSDL